MFLTASVAELERALAVPADRARAPLRLPLPLLLPLLLLLLLLLLLPNR